MASRICTTCGTAFEPRVAHADRCFSCWKAERRKPNADEVAMLKLELDRLHQATGHGRTAPIPPEIRRLLLQLAHPDKHGNSPASNAATQWLLSHGRL